MIITGTTGNTYALGKVLGKGAFGLYAYNWVILFSYRVREAVVKESGERVAIKIFDKS